jgi:hypothetical protein
LDHAAMKKIVASGFLMVVPLLAHHAVAAI